MKPTATQPPKRSRNLQGESPHWILIAGGALLSTLSIRLGFKLKQVLDARNRDSGRESSKVNGKSTDLKRSGSSHLHSDAFRYAHEENGYCNHYTGTRNQVQHCNGQMNTEPERALPLATIPPQDFSKENGVMWSSSPDRLDLPQKPLHQSNSFDSPCISESGSDIFSKREVIQKLRQQLKRRDDMILEMQDQIAELQNSLHAQISHSSHLQSLVDGANRDLFDSDREIQRLRKAIADYRVGNDKSPSVPVWPVEEMNGQTNGYCEVDGNLESPDKIRGGGEKIEMLKREISELREVIGGKDYLLKGYKEQKCELSLKIKELQQRLDSQLPNIL